MLFSLLISPNESFIEKFLLTLSNDCSHLFGQLVNYAIIIKPVTYEKTAHGELI